MSAPTRWTEAELDALAARLEHEEQYVDAVDDAIAALEWLRKQRVNLIGRLVDAYPELHAEWRQELEAARAALRGTPA